MSGSPVLGDWGSSRLRLWRLANGAVAERREGPGMLAVPDPGAALRDTLGDWHVDRLVLAGMAGARGGLREASYVRCPAGKQDWRRMAVEFDLGGLPVRIAAGCSHRDSRGRPDVVRGEETALFGAMSLDPALASGEHLAVLPGTHSKWVRIEGGRIAGFRTFVTGELYGLLGRSSLLGEEGGPGDDEDAGFADGLARAHDGTALSSALFEARSGRLEDGRSAAWAHGFVSGLLIGGEVAAMAPDGPVLVIGEAELAGRYARALARSAVDARLLDGEACSIAGLRLLDAD